MGENPVWRFLVGLYELPNPNEISVAFTLLLLSRSAMGGRRLWRGREKEKSSPLWISLFAAASVLAN